MAETPDNGQGNQEEIELPVINGRACVPVRLLPFLTPSWGSRMAPDAVANLFSHRMPRWAASGWTLTSHQLLPSGEHSALAPDGWLRYLEDLLELVSMSNKRETFPGENYRKWRDQSVRTLPKAVFVWRSDLEQQFSGTWGTKPILVPIPDARPISKKERKQWLDDLQRDEPDRSMEALPDRARSNLTVSRPDDGKLYFHPLLSSDERQVVFEGFEALMSPARHQYADEESDPRSPPAIDCLDGEQSPRTKDTAPDLADDAPMPAAVARADVGPSLPLAEAPRPGPIPPETPKERRARRLARLRDLDGDIRQVGEGWHLTGKRGAAAKLAREEAAKGRPAARIGDLRRDLMTAASEERSGK